MASSTSIACCTSKPSTKQVPDLCATSRPTMTRVTYSSPLASSPLTRSPPYSQQSSPGPCTCSLRWKGRRSLGRSPPPNPLSCPRRRSKCFCARFPHLRPSRVLSLSRAPRIDRGQNPMKACRLLPFWNVCLWSLFTTRLPPKKRTLFLLVFPCFSTHSQHHYTSRSPRFAPEVHPPPLIPPSSIFSFPMTYTTNTYTQPWLPTGPAYPVVL